MSDTEKNTQDLISSLSDDLSEVKSFPHPMKRAVLWSFIAIAYVVVVVAFLGIRTDISDKFNDPIYIFELSQILAIAVSAGFCSLWLCIPDMRGQNWMIAVPLSLFAVFFLWVGLRTILDLHKGFEVHWSHCQTDSILFGFVPALSIFFLSTKGKTTHPNLIALMSILSVGALGYLGLRITCSSDDVGHLCSYHILPYFLFGIGVSLLARRIYRW